MISSKRVPLNQNPLDFTTDELKKVDGGRVCAIVPTARNLRMLANKGFQTVELFSAKDFTSFANLASGVRIPKQLRPFYLRKAARNLSKKDKITIFKNENGIFFENFGAFAQASVGIFSFYRELSSEMVDMEKLALAGKYTDYEAQIDALKKLWNKYLELIADDGWREEWEDFKNPEFRADFIQRYDEFVFLIGGYLTKYELKQLESVSEIKNVTLIFNYAGNKYNLHKEYEKYLGIQLEDRPLKPISQNSCLIAPCPSMAAQVELITLEAFKLNKEHGVPFNEMAVLIPDEYVKEYFLRIDPYNLFDVSSNENIETLPQYSTALKLSELASEIKLSKTSSGEIEKVANILTSHTVKKYYDTKTALKEIHKKIESGKLYISSEEISRLPFFNDFAAEIFKTPSMCRPHLAASCLKNIFIKFANQNNEENRTLNEIIVRLDSLAEIYKTIPDDIEFAENIKMVFKELADIKIDTPKGKIGVTGILESRNLAFDVLFIPAMNEDVFPPAGKKDLFLNTEIRKEMGLPTFIDRDNLMKNYLLQIIEKSKFQIISYTQNQNARRRSRFVEEIVAKNKLNHKIFSPKNISILGTEKRFFPKNNDIIIEKNEKIMETINNIIFSATSFNDYIVCPLRFYFKRVDKIIPKNETSEKLRASAIGGAFHKTLEKLYKNEIKPSAPDFIAHFLKIFREELSRYDAYKFSPVERFIARQAERGIPKIAKAELEREMEGYKTIYREKELKSEFFGYKIKGYIDRIDEKDGQYDIIDYKFKKLPSFPKKLNLETHKDLQTPFYALLLETAEKIVPANLYYFDLKSSFQLAPAFHMDYYEEFKYFAKRKLDEVTSADKPFIKTTKISDCVYCDYSTICGRK